MNVARACYLEFIHYLVAIKQPTVMRVKFSETFTVQLLQPPRRIETTNSNLVLVNPF